MNRRGIDAGAKAEIYLMLQELLMKGWVSS